MFAMSFRRIALAQGLLPQDPARPPPEDTLPPPLRAEPDADAPEPCDERDNEA